MERPKLLDGVELVTKGAAKLEATLPEVGTKDVLPNGSWLQQKQIQAAIEARKHLLEIERIEKCGSITHAEWQEELMLAKVTKQAGSYWNYLGHNIGKQIYLKPEETLFLLEINSLLLKFNGVTVSLQQAYSLLLRGKVKLLQYKVYASLSRLGYKVFRYEAQTDILNVKAFCNGSSDNSQKVPEVKGYSEATEEKSVKDAIGDEDTVVTQNNTVDLGEDFVEQMSSWRNLPIVLIKDKVTQSDKEANKAINLWNNNMSFLKLRKCNLYERKLVFKKKKKETHKYFDEISFMKEVVAVRAPEEIYLPRNVYLNKNTYIVNITTVRTKSLRPSTSIEPHTYLNDEVNGEHIRRITSSRRDSISDQFTIYNNSQRYNRNFQQFSFYNRPQMNFNYYNYYQRPFNAYNWYGQRYYYSRGINNIWRQQYIRRQMAFYRLQMFNRYQDNRYGENTSINLEDMKRKRAHEKNALNFRKKILMDEIKQVASRVKQLMRNGSNSTDNNYQALHKLIQLYNNKYKVNLILNDELDVVNNIETIDLDPEETVRKRRKIATNPDYNENLNALKELAARLKLDKNLTATSRDRRAFSNLIKTFNKTYNSAIFLNESCEICDKRQIILDSSSDSDCVIEEPKTKKLRNPFSIIRNLNESSNTEIANETIADCTQNELDYDKLKRKFKNWLPDRTDFGRAEVVSKDFFLTRMMDTNKEEFIYNFLSNYNIEHDNWIDLKISFWEMIEHNSVSLRENQDTTSSSDSLQPLLKPEDCVNMQSVLKKLSIIKPNNDETNDVSIDFDVYERDVHNFKKSDRPRPHFRVICCNEMQEVPRGSDLAALRVQFENSVPIMFAVVGIGSISYVQMNPTELPMNIQQSDI